MYNLRDYGIHEVPLHVGGTRPDLVYALMEHVALAITSPMKLLVARRAVADRPVPVLASTLDREACRDCCVGAG